MSEAREYTDPELGDLPVKPFGTVRGGRPSIDVDNFDALRAAAHQLADAPARLVMGASIDECRALFRLAAVGADVIWLASAAIAASDAGASREQIIALQETLADFVRPLIGRE
jgi:hypothetical protein